MESSFREPPVEAEQRVRAPRPGTPTPHPAPAPREVPGGDSPLPLPTHLLAIKPTEKLQLSSWPVGATGLGGIEASGTMAGVRAEPRRAHFNTKLLGNCTKPLSQLCAQLSPALPTHSALTPLLPASLSRGPQRLHGPRAGTPAYPAQHPQLRAVTYCI